MGTLDGARPDEGRCPGGGGGLVDITTAIGSGRLGEGSIGVSILSYERSMPFFLCVSELKGDDSSSTL